MAQQQVLKKVFIAGVTALMFIGTFAFSAFLLSQFLMPFLIYFLAQSLAGMALNLATGAFLIGFPLATLSLIAFPFLSAGYTYQGLRQFSSAISSCSLNSPEPLLAHQAMCFVSREKYLAQEEYTFFKKNTIPFNSDLKEILILKNRIAKLDEALKQNTSSSHLIDLAKACQSAKAHCASIRKRG